MNNTTLLSLQQNMELELTDIHDSVGAIIFLIVVLFWYSLSIAFLLGMQMIVPAEIVEDSLRHSTKLFTQSFREKTANKKILEELVDKEKRDKLWCIYLGTSGDIKSKLIHAEALRIRNIQRQLAAINRYDRDDKERIQSSYDGNSFDLSSVPTIALADSRLRVRHHSCTDQQILEEWETTVDGLKTHANLPCTVRRLFIRRYLRRQRHTKDYLSLRRQSIL